MEMHSNDQLLSDGDYQKYLPQLNVHQLNPTFPVSPSSGRTTGMVKDSMGPLSYVPMMGEQTFPAKAGHSDLLEPMMSPPITPGDKLQNYQSHHSSPLMSPHMSPFPGNAPMAMPFGLSPPLTISGSPELHYGDVYHNQADVQYDGYGEQPIYHFMGMDPHAMGQEQQYDEHYGNQISPPPQSASVYPSVNRMSRLHQLKHSGSDASLASWSTGPGNGSYGSNASPGAMHGEWQASPEPGFACTFPGCHKVFTKQTNLKSHSRIHHTERNYACHECGASFRRSHDLKRHQRSLHSDVKPFGCGRCGKRFSRMDALKRHTSRTTSACFQQY
ncbi:hypothetical protein HDV03_004059 [Kappamyces sp. JEL0829]|nr:hypothetical protein HDV03_004059 [Kappamyces sp. JEL0829]KAJ3367406.1 hypothetical protein HDU91_001457 [Kappamyces sp. JEL0680]